MNKEQAVVRRATEQDLAVLLSLASQLLKHDAAFDTTLDKNWAQHKDARQMFLQRIKQSDGVVYIAEIAGKAVGYIVGGFIAVDSFRRIKKLVEIEEILVVEEFRHYAIGAQLMQNFYLWCQKSGGEKISVSVYAGNQRAINFYKKCGFGEHSLTLERSV